MPELILASTSSYRRSLLQRLGLPFSVADPQVDETPQAGERPLALATRLASAKALRIASQRPAAVVIGADQVADLDGEPINKPGSHERAAAQLRMLSGRTAVFHSAFCLARVGSGQTVVEVVSTEVCYRRLDDATIERYLRIEQPYDCAGSAKAEGLGIALIESIRCDDPTALIGLPLIALSRLLPDFGLSVP